MKLDHETPIFRGDNEKDIWVATTWQTFESLNKHLYFKNGLPRNRLHLGQAFRAATCKTIIISHQQIADFWTCVLCVWNEPFYLEVLPVLL